MIYFHSFINANTPHCVSRGVSAQNIVFCAPKCLVCVLSGQRTRVTSDGRNFCSSLLIEPRIKTKSDMKVDNLLPLNLEDKRTCTVLNKVLKSTKLRFATKSKRILVKQRFSIKQRSTSFKIWQLATRGFRIR